MRPIKGPPPPGSSTKVDDSLAHRKTTRSVLFVAVPSSSTSSSNSTSNRVLHQHAYSMDPPRCRCRCRCRCRRRRRRSSGSSSNRHGQQRRRQQHSRARSTTEPFLLPSCPDERGPSTEIPFLPPPPRRENTMWCHFAFSSVTQTGHRGKVILCLNGLADLKLTIINYSTVFLDHLLIFLGSRSSK